MDIVARRTGSLAAATLLVAVVVTACASLIGTDFSGEPRVDDAATADQGEGEDASSRQGGDAQGDVNSGDSAYGDGAPSDAADGSDVADAERSSGPDCYVSGGLCYCNLGVGEGATCTADTFPGGFCCADPDYPQSGQCTCSAWTCHVAASGTCLCGGYPEAGPGSSCQDAYCCAHPYFYTCGCEDAAAYACPSALPDANNVPIASCTVAAQPCPDGGRRVSTCMF